MQFLLFFGTLAIILPSSFSVHPGDPFPIDQSELKNIISENLIDTNEITDPNDDVIPPEPPIGPTSDEDNLVDFVISTSTPSTLVTNKSHHKNIGRKYNLNIKLLSPTTKFTPIYKSDDDNLNENPSLSEESLMLLPVKSINRKNLIKVGRWKHEDLQTKTVRYWYEPEGGHMGAGWSFDGFIFEAYNKSEPDTEPIYAFHSEVRSIWTNTVQMDPKPPITGNDQWISDGVSFYAYKTSLNSTELQPVLRYWSKLKAGTTDATETRITYLTMKKADDDENEDGFGWTYDTTLFYALPIENGI